MSERSRKPYSQYSHTQMGLPRISEKGGVLCPVQSCLPRTMVSGRDLGGVRSWRPHSVLQSYPSYSAVQSWGKDLPMYFVLYRVPLFI